MRVPELTTSHIREVSTILFDQRTVITKLLTQALAQLGRHARPFEIEWIAGCEMDQKKRDGRHDEHDDHRVSQANGDEAPHPLWLRGSQPDAIPIDPLVRRDRPVG